MGLYLDNGFLDMEWVDRYADKHNVAFIIIIGKRQVGKTYGVLNLMLTHERRFILMRRTDKELQIIQKPKENPFNKIKGYQNRISFVGSQDSGIYDLMRLDTSEEGDTQTDIGTALSLTRIATIRGFDGDPYTDLVYDEAIPEAHVYKIPHEDDAFNNAHVTISGNRELEGKPPLRCWILANSNKLDCAILKALNLTETVEKMSKNGEEMRLLKDRGVLILYPDSALITEKRSETALYKAIGGKNNFTRMSLGNEFSYNDYSDVKHVELTEYFRICSIDDVDIYKHKSRAELYACWSCWNKPPKNYYPDTEYYRRKFQKEFPSIRAYFQRGRVFFQNGTVKSLVISYIFD